MKDFLKAHLPTFLVRYIQSVRKIVRTSRRYLIHTGTDFSHSVTYAGHSFSIFINPFLNGGVDNDIYTTGEWEPEIADLIKQYLSPGATFLDIGANIGYHTLGAASIVGTDGNVLAFEPLPRLCSQLKKSIAINNFTNCTVHNVGLSDASGKGTLSLVDENIGASSLQAVDGQRAVLNKVEVSLETLDSYLSTIKRVDLIKIDIEGSEYEALKGGEALLRQYRPVIVLEFSPQVYEVDYAGKTLDFYHFLVNLGYSLSVIENNDISIQSKIEQRDWRDLHANLLCVPS